MSSKAADLPKTVAIVGGGTIGASWAALFAAAGMAVRIYDPAEGAAQSVRAYVERAWPSLERLGLAKSSRQELRFFAHPEEAVEGVGFVQESVPERLEIKHAIYRQIEPALDPQTIVATSASGLLLQDMQEGWSDPGRLILGHPFNPPHLIPLVELLGNARTADGVLDRAETFYAACGKVTIRVQKEVPGHVANRLQAALWREAIHLVVEGVASVEDVDKAVSAGPGLRWSVMGPHLLFALGSGGSGLETFCKRYRASFHTWWDSLGQPLLDQRVRETLASGVKDEEAGRTFEGLSAERDEKLIAVMQALAESASH